MRWLASLVITISLVVGTVSAITAYVPPLDAVAGATPPLTLAAPAGEAPGGGPVVAPPAVLDEEVVATLRAAGVERVRVKEFSFGRWTSWWWFALAVIGLLVGAAMMKTSARREIAAAPAPGAGKGPDEMLRMARDELVALRDGLDGMESDDRRLHAIIDVIDAVRLGRFEPFVESRVVLVARLGMGGYAQLMDRFATAERQLNRSWSAAADEILDEATVCLRRGIARLEEARERLGAAATARP